MAAVLLFIIYIAFIGLGIPDSLSSRLTCWQIIRAGQGTLGIAIAILLLPVPPYAAAGGLFLAGLGNGPLFPNFNYLTPENFGKEASQSVMGSQMAASYMGIMLAPALCGILGQSMGMGVFPFYLLALYLAMMAASPKARRLSGP